MGHDPFAKHETHHLAVQEFPLIVAEPLPILGILGKIDLGGKPLKLARPAELSQGKGIKIDRHERLLNQLAL